MKKLLFVLLLASWAQADNRLSVIQKPMEALDVQEPSELDAAAPPCEWWAWFCWQ